MEKTFGSKLGPLLAMDWLEIAISAVRDALYYSLKVCLDRYLIGFMVRLQIFKYMDCKGSECGDLLPSGMGLAFPQPCSFSFSSSRSERCVGCSGGEAPAWLNIPSLIWRYDLGLGTVRTWRSGPSFQKRSCKVCSLAYHSPCLLDFLPRFDTSPSDTHYRSE